MPMKPCRLGLRTMCKGADGCRCDRDGLALVCYITYARLYYCRLYYTVDPVITVDRIIDN